VWPSRSPTRTASSPRRPRGATAGSARTSPRTCGPSPTCPNELLRDAPEVLEVRGEVYLPVAHVRRAQPASGGGRAAAVREPPQHRGRLVAAEGPVGHRHPWARRCGATSSARSWAAPPSTATPRRSSTWRRSGCRSTPRSGGSTGSTRSRRTAHWQEHRHDLDYEIDGVVVKVDDLPARGARVHRQGAAVGHRLQVPARGAHHAPARHPGVDRPHRQGHPVRRARAGLRRRLHGGDGHAAQPGPGAAEGRPPRRHRHRAQGGRRHPRGRRPGAGRAAPRARVEFPSECPALRRPARAPRGRGPPLLRQPRLPGTAHGRIEHFASRGAMDIEGLGEQRVHLFTRAGAAQRRRRPLHDRLRPGPRARGVRRDLGREPARRDRRIAQRPLANLLVGLNVRHLGPAGAAPWPARSATSTRSSPPLSRSPSRPSRASGPPSPQSVHEFFPRAQPGGGRQAAGRGGQPRGAGRGPRWPRPSPV
jgi:DNA ligase (NAD+)